MQVTPSSRRRRSYSDRTGIVVDHDDYGNPRHRRGDGMADPIGRSVEPPRPIGPSDEERRAYLSDTHTRKLVRDGILAKDLDEAIAIVEAYAGVRTMPIASDATKAHPDSDSGMGVVMIALGETMLQRGSDAFLERVKASIRASMEERGSYYEGWDYEGPGPFHKCTIRIAPAGGGLVVRISAVRRNPEPRLAEQFGLRMRFLRASHHVTWETRGDDFSIPIVQLQGAARIAGAATPPDAATILDGLVTPRGDDMNGRAVLHEDEHLQVVATFDEVRVPADWRLRDMAGASGLATVPDDWRPHLVDDEDGPRIVGRALTWREWPNPWAAGVHIEVVPVDPMDPDHEAACIAVSADIARRWAGLPGAWGDSDK